MKNKKRALRRFHEKRIQRKRRRHCFWWGDSPSGKQLETDKDNHYGLLKTWNTGCGCIMCKPWKHGCDHKYTASERRRLQEEE